MGAYGIKLRPDFVLQQVDGASFLVPVGGEAFGGILRGNATLGFILELLREDTDGEAVLDAMCARYDAPRDQMGEDLAEILCKLRQVGALEE